jgi:hypothetical protein
MKLNKIRIYLHNNNVINLSTFFIHFLVFFFPSHSAMLYCDVFDAEGVTEGWVVALYILRYKQCVGELIRKCRFV